MITTYLIHDKKFFINKVLSHLENNDFFATKDKIDEEDIAYLLLDMQVGQEVARKSKEEFFALQAIKDMAQIYSLHLVYQESLPLVNTSKHVFPFLSLSPRTVWWESLDSPRKPDDLQEINVFNNFPTPKYAAMLMISDA